MAVKANAKGEVVKPKKKVKRKKIGKKKVTKKKAVKKRKKWTRKRKKKKGQKDNYVIELFQNKRNKWHSRIVNKRTIWVSEEYSSYEKCYAPVENFLATIGARKFNVYVVPTGSKARIPIGH